MSLLLDVTYAIGLLLASPWVAYRLVRTGGWRALPARFAVVAPPRLSQSIWLHGASVGEVSLLKPLVLRLEQERPGTRVVISTCTPTGLAAARKAYPRHCVILFPFDLSIIVRRFLRRLDPRLIIVVESEFWPNFLLAARRRNVPVVVLNGKVSEKSLRAYRLTGFVPHALRSVRLVAVQNDEQAARFRQLGVDAARVHVTGNMKYDLTREPGDSAARNVLRSQLGYSPDVVVAIGGSLHAGEAEALLAAFAALTGEPRKALVLVPRYPEDAASIAARVEAVGLIAVRKTRVDRGEAPAPGPQAVLIVDTVGELGRLYGAADLAFVGGSLFFRGSNKGGHNLMEPAILGVPVLFGPYNYSFRETVADLLDENAGILVRDEAELTAALARLVADGRLRRHLGEAGRRVVVSRQGATERNCALIADALGETPPRLQAQAFERTMPRASGHLDSR